MWNRCLPEANGSSLLAHGMQEVVGSSPTSSIEAVAANGLLLALPDAPAWEASSAHRCPSVPSESARAAAKCVRTSASRDARMPCGRVVSTVNLSDRASGVSHQERSAPHGADRSRYQKWYLPTLVLVNTVGGPSSTVLPAMMVFVPSTPALKCSPTAPVISPEARAAEA